MRIFIISVFCILMMLTVPAQAETNAAANTIAVNQPVQGELWTKRCQDVAAKDSKTKVTYCEVFQRLEFKPKDSKTSQRVVEFAIGYPPGEKTARAVIALPLGILVQETLSIFIDEKDENHFHIQYCLADGCYATLNLPENILSKISRGSKLLLKGKAMNGQDLRIALDLGGISKAVQQIKP